MIRYKLQMDRDQTPINARRHRRPPQALEDLSLALRDRVVWPLQDRLDLLGDRARGALAAGAVALAVAAGVGGFAVVSSHGTRPKPAVEVAAAVRPAPAAVEAPVESKPAPAPTLHGAAPVFTPPKEGSSGLADGRSIESGAADGGSDTGSAASDTISSSPAGAGAASASAAEPKGPPAPAAAIAVAREFAQAFVVYETGGDRETVRDGFVATATPRLRKALLRRPPRQPAGVEVPRAKVVNVVPAPSRGSVYPLSVSLLRVGVTSELRLEMERLKNKHWRVVNVLG